MNPAKLWQSLLVAALTLALTGAIFAGCDEAETKDTTDTSVEADADTDTDTDTDADTDSDTDTDAGLDWGCVCTGDEDCASGICHEFGQDGLVCTSACDDAEDCPPQNDGSDAKCNSEGRCKTGAGNVCE